MGRGVKQLRLWAPPVVDLLKKLIEEHKQGVVNKSHFNGVPIQQATKGYFYVDS